MTVTVDAVVYFRIQNATVSVTNVEDAQGSTRLLAQTSLRNMIGTRNLSDILMDREGLSTQMQVNKCSLLSLSVAAISADILINRQSCSKGESLNRDGHGGNKPKRSQICYYGQTFNLITKKIIERRILRLNCQKTVRIVKNPSCLIRSMH